MQKGLCNAVVALLVLGSAACGDGGGGPASGSAAKPGPATSAKPAASTPVKSSASAATSAGPEERGGMSHCSAAVQGAKTEIKDIDKGVEIVVTAADAKVTEEIRGRAKTTAERAKGESTKPQHSGQGGGGGVMGRCPVVLGGTEVKVEDVDGGSKFTVTAKDAAEVDWLRREAKERLAALETGDGGDRKMQNCPSAAKDSKTTVKEAGGSIVVTVVAKDAKNEAVVKDIRDRAKKSAETKHEGTGKEHAGTGAGGGKEGRCPSVLENADITAKDVDGGSEISLKPKKAEDLKKLTEEATARAKPFE